MTQADTASASAASETLAMISLQSFDLVAHFEPSADFTVTHSLRRSLNELAGRFSKPTLLSGKHSGRPKLHTDIKGISVGSRIEVSRLALRRQSLPDMLADAFAIFDAAQRERLASGPIRRILVGFRKAFHRPEPRAAVREAYRRVFKADCHFMTYREELEVGRTVDHQSLLEHLSETGPYHSDYAPEIETVRSELGKQAGRYEGHRFFVEPLASDDGGKPGLRYCYTGVEPCLMVETAMRHRTDVKLEFVPESEVTRAGDRYVSLGDYELACRRYGQLWVRQDDLVRPLERYEAAGMYLFFDKRLQPELNRDFNWKELHERQATCEAINRGSRRSPAYLDLMLDRLMRKQIVVRRKDRFALHPNLPEFRHVTFYQIGEYERRLAA